MYARLADAMRERGAEIVRVSEGDSFDGYIGGGRITYVCDVATVSMSGDLVHTHSAKPMEFLLNSGLQVDFVVGDHGFTGAALARGLDAVAVVDTNDPALVLAWGRKLPHLADPVRRQPSRGGVPLDDRLHHRAACSVRAATRARRARARGRLLWSAWGPGVFDVCLLRTDP